jgi:uncharacterized membrane protein YuzA (DUF378 family)
MAKMKWFDWTAFVLLVIGGINWGLVGLLDFNLVTTIFRTDMLSTIVYGLVGVSGLYGLYMLFKLM